MPFCPECKSMLYPDPEAGMKCNKCGFTTQRKEGSTITHDVQVKQTVILEGRVDVLPTMKMECPKCGNMEAYWILRQTRKSDEPETTFLTCTACRHKWRRY